MIKIRNYQKKDYSQVASILKEADLYDEVWDSEDNLSGMNDKDSESIIVAELDDLVVGNLFIIPYGNKVSYLFRLAVKTQHRQQGIASSLMKHATNIAKNKGVTEIGLYVDSKNQELQSFYKNEDIKFPINRIITCGQWWNKTYNFYFVSVLNRKNIF